MKHLLQNPVFNALLSGDRQLSFGNEKIKYFDEQVSPFAGFDHDYKNGFNDLHDKLLPGREILYATPYLIALPPGWELLHEIKGLQFVYQGVNEIKTESLNIHPLSAEHTEQMINLAALTKPGPFAQRTIEFGSYFGIFDDQTLVAMTGQRLHVKNFTEISAVCTHPGHLGKGYAFALLQHQLKLILRLKQQPFLHVRDDNKRAIALYERLGFSISRSMNFYFMKRK